MLIKHATLKHILASTHTHGPYAHSTTTLAAATDPIYTAQIRLDFGRLTPLPAIEMKFLFGSINILFSCVCGDSLRKTAGPQWIDPKHDHHPRPRPHPTCILAATGEAFSRGFWFVCLTNVNYRLLTLLLAKFLVITAGVQGAHWPISTHHLQHYFANVLWNWPPWDTFLFIDTPLPINEMYSF